jgi:hypothetical protein
MEGKYPGIIFRYDTWRMETWSQGMLQKCPLLCNGLLKHISAATNMSTTVKRQSCLISLQLADIKQVAISRSVKNVRERERELHNPRVDTEKYGHESYGTQSQE